MDEKMEIMDNRKLAGKLAKLPENVLQRIMYLIEDAQFFEDAQKGVKRDG